MLDGTVGKASQVPCLLVFFVLRTIQAWPRISTVQAPAQVPSWAFPVRWNPTRTPPLTSLCVELHLAAYASYKPSGLKSLRDVGVIRSRSEVWQKPWASICVHCQGSELQVLQRPGQRPQAGLPKTRRSPRPDSGEPADRRRFRTTQLPKPCQHYGKKAPGPSRVWFTGSDSVAPIVELQQHTSCSRPEPTKSQILGSNKV
jgi:hypothetical protein